MAVKNEILAGRYNRFLQKFLSMKGSPPSPQLASEIMAVWSMFHGVENRYLEGWDRFGIFTQSASGAGVTGGIRVRNPVGSNVIAVFEKIFTFTNTADNPILDHGASTTDLGNLIALNITRFDSRGRTSPSLILSQQTNPLGLLNNVKWQGLLVANSQLDLILFEEQEVVLLPGDALQYRTTVFNIQASVSWWWRERALEESEIK